MKILCFPFLLLIAAGVSGQTVSGVVVDGDGAAVERASVSIVNGTTVQTTTDGEGRFTMTAAVTESTRIVVKADGFATYERRLEPGDHLTLNIVLEPAPVTADVNVSVTRSEENQVNASIAVITIESLGVTAARTADDTLRQIASFGMFRRSSSRTTNPTAQGANFRGVAGSGASRASVLFDGLSLNDAFGGWTYWSRVPMIAVEQIEVFSGGASPYYGSGGLSGAVNIVPLKRRDRGFVTKLETSAGSQNTADLSGVVLASSGKWQFDAVGDVFKTGGYIPVQAASRGSVDAPASSRHSNLILKLGRSFGDSTKVFVRGNMFGESRENGTRLTDNQTDFRQFAAGIDLATKHYGEFVIRAFGERQTYDQTFSAVSADRNTETLTRLQRVPSRAFGGSLLWRKTTAKNNIVASAEMLKVRGFSDETGIVAGNASSFTRSGGEARDVSFFVANKWRVTTKFSLDLAARVDVRNNFDAVMTVRTLSTGALTETRFPDRRDTSFSPRIAASYEVNDAVGVFASFSQSFRAPSLNELYRGFRVGNIVTQANAFLTPERANTFEAGGSFTKRSSRLMIVRAFVFLTRVNDPVVSVTLATTPSLITRQRQNVGGTLSRGLEADTQLELAPRLKFTAFYLFVDSTISDFPAEPQLVGNRLPQSARHTFTAQARYDLGSRWNISTQIRASSSQFEDDRNTLRLRKYFTADARVSYKVYRYIEAFAAVENMLNSRYDIGRTPVSTVAAPRSVRFGLRISFPGN